MEAKDIIDNVGINETGTVLTSSILENVNYPNHRMIDTALANKYILEYAVKNDSILADYGRTICKKESVPIFNRTIGFTDTDGVFKIDPTKINNQINNDFAGYIVQTKASYICSIPPAIGLRDGVTEALGETEVSKLKQVLEDFKIRNSWDSKLLSTAEMMGATGKSCWILSVEDGNPKINIVNPWEIIEVVEGQLYIRNYKAKNFQLEDVEYLDIYDKYEVMRYKTVGGGYVAEQGYPKKHLFNECPVVIFKNNDRELCDFNNVRALIDQYDKTFSDLTSEVEQFRLAYLVITGVMADKTEIDKFKQTGVLNLNAMPGTNPDAKFIIKNIDIASTIRLLQEIQDNIMRFSGSFDATDDSYTGNLTNFAIHFKLAPMEGRAKKSVANLKDGIRKAFKCIQHIWNLQGLKINYLDLTLMFTLDKPVNKQEELKALIEAGATISDETLFGMTSFIDNAKDEMERVKREGKEPSIRYQAPPTPTPIETKNPITNPKKIDLNTKTN